MILAESTVGSRSLLSDALRFLVRCGCASQVDNSFLTTPRQNYEWSDGCQVRVRGDCEAFRACLGEGVSAPYW